MPKKIKILWLSAELSPFVKVGGLADVAGALPKSLSPDKVEIAIFLPFYGSISASRYQAKKLPGKLSVKIDGHNEEVSIFKSFLPGTSVPVYLLKHRFFSNKQVYGDSLNFPEYGFEIRELQKFSFYSKAALAASELLGFQPDIIHCQDWHTALVPDMVKAWPTSWFSRSKTLLTIHNLGSQGAGFLGFRDIISPGFKPLILEKNQKTGYINCMAQGLMAADAVSTVSPSYAKEITSKKYGAGLDRLVRRRRQDLYGIINGIDTEVFDPQSDTCLLNKYGACQFDSRLANKSSLQRQLKLKADPKAPIIGWISRFVEQKGIKLISEKLLSDTIRSSGAQWVFLGSGDPKQEALLRGLADKYPDNIRLTIGFDLKLAQRIYAASDIFLVPSFFEPCGLTQMMAMRYGAVPLVRSTGGLKDTVREPSWPTDAKSLDRLNINKSFNGFTFSEFSSAALSRAFARALKVYRQYPRLWRQLQSNGGKTDFSWKLPARSYPELYKELLRKK